MQFIATEGAPHAIGPYSQAVKAGSLIFTSGQIPIDPSTSKLLEGDFAAQTRRVFENLKAVLESSGAGFRHVVKVTVFLKDLENFKELNAIYAEYFGGHKPARSTVAVANLPMDAAVEIDMIAIAE